MIRIYDWLLVSTFNRYPNSQITNNELEFGACEEFSQTIHLGILPAVVRGDAKEEDIDGFLSLLTNDFYIKMPGQPAISDASELRKGLEQYHQMFKSTMDWKIEETQFFENHAVVRVTENVRLINRQTDETSEYNGVHLALLMKDGDSWKLKTDVSSLNQ